MAVAVPATPEARGVVVGAGRRPRFRKWFVSGFMGQEQDWMDATARYYFHVTRELRRAYLESEGDDKRLEWLKDLTLERLKLSGENFRSYVIATGAALVSFVAAQLGADVPSLPLEANLAVIIVALLVLVYLSLLLQYANVHLSARMNGLCEILREVSQGVQGRAASSELRDSAAEATRED